MSATITYKEAVRLVSYDPETGILIRLTGPLKGHRAGFEKAGSGGYRKVTFGHGHAVSIHEHRLAWLLMTGSFPPDHLMIDHIDGDPSNNKWINLRVVDPCQNAWNCGLAKNNTSGRTGVSWHPDVCRWVVKITARGVVYRYGSYKDFDVAVRVREMAEIKHYGCANWRQSRT